MSGKIKLIDERGKEWIFSYSNAKERCKIIVAWQRSITEIIIIPNI